MSMTTWHPFETAKHLGSGSALYWPKARKKTGLGISQPPLHLSVKMASKPENDRFADLNPRERKSWCDAAALAEYAERELNDPTFLAACDTVQEVFRLERKARPAQRRLEIVTRKVEGVNLFASPHPMHPRWLSDALSPKRAAFVR